MEGSDQQTNMSEIKEICKNINESCKAIAKRDGFELPPVGGYYKKQNGFWEFREGEGDYQKINGEMQWVLN